MQVLGSLANQKADYIVATSLLFGAFALQIFALVFPQLGILNRHEALYVAMVGSVLTLIGFGFGFGMLLVKPLAAHYQRQAKKALDARIVKSSKSTAPPAAAPGTASITESDAG
ncbi:MAG: hypothetical protein ACT6Q9_06485 [Polaromonas sp.]|uniref:hypothetical protein n=1 Tax=Polaromonas sp. TaxID=1869339 RepID=UPI0040363E07